MRKLSVLLSLLALGGFSQASASVEITGMRCEYLDSPLGIDTQSPRFTWEYLGSDLPAKVPTVELSADSLFRKSKKIKASGMNFASPSKNPGLRPSTRYYWRVVTGDSKSPVASFETGKMNRSDWKASWISDGLTKEEPVAPVFLKEFTLDEAPRDARLYISAVGYYDLLVNGQRITLNHMDPGFTDYSKRSLYVTHDVTPYLRKGENTVEVTLGNGFSNNQLHDVWNQENAHWRGRPQFICEITVDGKTVAATDASWETALSPVVYNNIYSGDHIDARITPEDWKPAKVVEPRSPLLVAQAMHPIRLVETIDADMLRSWGDTLFIYDMGKNIAGVTEMRLKGKPGTVVKVRHGEILKSNGRVERGNIDIYYHPARDDEEFQTETVFP